MFYRIPKCTGLLESVFGAIVNRLRACPPLFLSAVFVADWRAGPPSLWRACPPLFWRAALLTISCCVIQRRESSRFKNNPIHKFF